MKKTRLIEGCQEKRCSNSVPRAIAGSYWFARAPVSYSFRPELPVSAGSYWFARPPPVHTATAWSHERLRVATWSVQPPGPEVKVGPAEELVRLRGPSSHWAKLSVRVGRQEQVVLRQDQLSEDQQALTAPASRRRRFSMSAPPSPCSELLGPRIITALLRHPQKHAPDGQEMTPTIRVRLECPRQLPSQ